MAVQDVQSVATLRYVSVPAVESALTFEHEPDDPQEILRMLPEADRKRFRRVYRFAARRAAIRPTGYAELRKVLWQWRLRAIGGIEFERDFEQILAVILSDERAGYATPEQPFPWYYSTVVRFLTVVAESGPISVPDYAYALTRVLVRIGAEQALSHERWTDLVRPDEQQALDEAILVGTRRLLAEQIAELSAQRLDEGRSSENGNGALEPYPRQNKTGRPALQEVLDRIGRRQGGTVGFEEAVNIIENERNER